MDSWATPDRWESLRDELGCYPFVRDFVSNGDLATDCALGLDDSARLHLMICVADDSSPLPPDLNGITIRYVESERLLVVVAADAALESIVSPVFDSIICGCIDGRNPVEAITDNLERIRKAFSRAGSAISENKQIGLVGELIVMRHIVIPGIGHRAAFQWSGPLSEKHDFVGDVVHVEVKSTTRSMDQHEISRIDQLRAPEGKKLLLISVQLERSIAGDLTIATLRNEVNNALASNGSAQDVFDKKMQAMGWHEGLVQSDSLLRFNLRSLSVFSVDGSFPRLPDDYIPPRGVVAISYTINVSACRIMERDDVMSLVGEM